VRDCACRSPGRALTGDRRPQPPHSGRAVRIDRRLVSSRSLSCGTKVNLIVWSCQRPLSRSPAGAQGRRVADLWFQEHLVDVSHLEGHVRVVWMSGSCCPATREESPFFREDQVVPLKPSRATGLRARNTGLGDAGHRQTSAQCLSSTASVGRLLAAGVFKEIPVAPSTERPGEHASAPLRSRQLFRPGRLSEIVIRQLQQNTSAVGVDRVLRRPVSGSSDLTGEPALYISPAFWPSSRA